LKIRAAVFDLGKVLVDFDYGIAARELAASSSAPAAKIQALIDQSPLLLRYERAGMTTQEFYEEVRQRIGYQGDFETFAAAFADIFTEIPEMTQLHAELRGRGLPTFVLSNTNEIAISHVRRNFAFFSSFTDFVFSFEHGVLKPEPAIYEIVERLSDCRESEILFLDDKPENVEAGRQRGWQVICHQSASSSISAVQGILT
jgi:HAD superfamily hydrolase (TIGR01509 family)